MCSSVAVVTRYTVITRRTNLLKGKEQKNLHLLNLRFFLSPPRAFPLAANRAANETSSWTDLLHSGWRRVGSDEKRCERKMMKMRNRNSRISVSRSVCVCGRRTACVCWGQSSWGFRLKARLKLTSSFWGFCRFRFHFKFNNPIQMKLLLSTCSLLFWKPDRSYN